MVSLTCFQITITNEQFTLFQGKTWKIRQDTESNTDYKYIFNFYLNNNK